MFKKDQQLIITGQIQTRIGEVVTYERKGVANKVWVKDKTGREFVMPIAALAPTTIKKLTPPNASVL